MALTLSVGMAVKNVRRWLILNRDVRVGPVGGPRLGTCCMIRCFWIRLDVCAEAKVVKGTLVILVWETYVLSVLLNIVRGQLTVSYVLVGTRLTVLCISAARWIATEVRVLVWTVVCMAG